MESNIITLQMKKLRLREPKWLFQVPQLIIVRIEVKTSWTFAQVEKESMTTVTLSLKLCLPQQPSELATQIAVS